MQRPAEPLTCLEERPFKRHAGTGDRDKILAVVAAIEHVLHRSGVLNSQEPRHAHTLSLSPSPGIPRNSNRQQPAGGVIAVIRPRPIAIAMSSPRRRGPGPSGASYCRRRYSTISFVKCVGVTPIPRPPFPNRRPSRLLPKTVAVPRYRPLHRRLPPQPECERVNACSLFPWGDLPDNRRLGVKLWM